MYLEFISNIIDCNCAALIEVKLKLFNSKLNLVEDMTGAYNFENLNFLFDDKFFRTF